MLHCATWSDDWLWLVAGCWLPTVFLAALVLVCGSVLAAVPYLTRGREAFAVTVPARAQSDPEVRSMKRICAIVVGSASAAFAAAVILILAAFVVLMVRYGQDGPRAIRRLAPRETDCRMCADDDALWKAGVFYSNPDDRAVLVSKRFGIG